MIKIIGISFLSVLCIASCGKKCKDAEDNARTKPKNVSLMYIWRYTDNLIKHKTNTSPYDSGFVSFKPNGDYMHGANLKDLNAVPTIWYLNNDIIVNQYCTENIPGDNNIAKYFIRNDTLFLNYYSGSNVIYPAETFIHFRKY